MGKEKGMEEEGKERELGRGVLWSKKIPKIDPMSDYISSNE